MYQFVPEDSEFERTREEKWNSIWSQLCHASRTRAQEIQPERHERYLHISKNAMSIGGEAIPCDDTMHRTMYEHQIEAHESQRCRIQPNGRRRHEDHSADRGSNSQDPYNLVHKPIPHPQAMKMLLTKCGTHQ